MASAAAERATGAIRWRGIVVSILLFAAAAVGSAALLFQAVPDLRFAAAFLAGLVGVAGILALLTRRSRGTVAIEGDAPAPIDAALARSALTWSESSHPAALTTADTLELVAANEAFAERFGAPERLTDLADDEEAADALLGLVNGFGDGQQALEETRLGEAQVSAEVQDAPGGLLFWRIRSRAEDDLPRLAEQLITGEPGQRLGEAGIMAVLADASGEIRAANPVFIYRAGGEGSEAVVGRDLVQFLSASPRGQFYFTAEGKGAAPLRILQVPVGAREEELGLFFLLDELGLPVAEGEEGIHLLLENLPLGLALADADGRFTFLNRSFRRAAGLGPSEPISWPGDLVVDDDKAAVSDLVHRFARGRGGLTGDLAVRLRANPEEPVALTVAGARGLGSAAVLLSLKDNSEEARLKREIAQATKMQAVGQLAGGVAHDFNNILTAILGTCDLMLMRHLPGDPDYDDIQQIRQNSNRAANLTRQLLAFSRQQTLRPQVLQLPDAVSEVTHLLNRLLGERVKLQVKHGRNLGAIRADPGQLEQVIVNLAVNARDAMQAKRETGAGDEVGTLSIETFAVTPDDVRRMGSDIMPISDYTALRITDTGTGIPPAILSKIFEPFFTTKEVGKGTGLGLSTVYGIVKQSGGFIFADSKVGEGTRFTIYLPVHHAPTAEAAQTAKPRKAEPAGDLWGTATVLLVEDEAMVRAVAERALTRHGYTVLTAESGEAALEILDREETIDLMISDVVMPTMDGPTTVRAAREARPDLPVLFISGYAEEQLRKSIDIDNVAFLPKPFSVQQLAEAVRDVLQRK